MRVMSWTRPCPGLDLSHCLCYLTLLLWTRRLSGLADFSNYLSRIITSHSAHACDGQPLRLHCPRHSTISIQSAFYGSGEVWACREDPDPPLGARNHSCSAFTALQKLLSECQSHRDCQLPVNHLLFGKDPCPGTSKYLHVDYRCKPSEFSSFPRAPPCSQQLSLSRLVPLDLFLPQLLSHIRWWSLTSEFPAVTTSSSSLFPPRSAEHRRHVACEGDTMVLSCKPPRLLIIYAAVYGRSLGHTDTCPSHLTRPPPFECLNHKAVHSVSKSCHSKQKCAVAVSNQTFRDPCFPGTRKYLSVIYSCVPQSLLREADPGVFSSTPSPPVEPEKDLEEVLAKGSRRPGNSGAVMSTSLLTYAYIRAHPEMAALLFTSSVCVGLLFTLLAVSVRVTCRGRRLRDHGLQTRSCSQTVKHQEEEDEDEDDDDDDEGTESSVISATERKAACDWEEVTYESEAADRAERIERRDMVIQEIWMNAYLNGSSC
nr:PREDICTED: protein eva-1 homolog C isoform X2 [Paralichthys olivaceus]